MTNESCISPRRERASNTKSANRKRHNILDFLAQIKKKSNVHHQNLSRRYITLVQNKVKYTLETISKYTLETIRHQTTIDTPYFFKKEKVCTKGFTDMHHNSTQLKFWENYSELFMWKTRSISDYERSLG